MNVFREVDTELARWSDAGLVPRFWLRDDDAVEPSNALDRLAAIATRFDAPMLLAVVPAQAQASLAERLAAEPLLTPCVHGWSHANHMPEGVEPMELGGRRAEDVIVELRAGRDRLATLFGERLSGILVPPWNRIAPDVAARVHECGFSAISEYSWRKAPSPLPQLNTHVDIMDWSGRRGRDTAWTAGELLRRLRQARERAGAPIGILTHHLVHDGEAWATLEAVLAYLRGRRGLILHHADALVAASRPAHRARSSG